MVHKSNTHVDNSITIPLPPSQGGTGTTTVFTQGSVVFAGASGVYTQDNPNFFYDATAKTLKVSGGVITPKIYPLSDSTTAIQILKANGSTAIVTVDTTNSSVGIGTTTPGTNTLYVNKSNGDSTFAGAGLVVDNSGGGNTNISLAVSGSRKGSMRVDGSGNVVLNSASQTFYWNSDFGGNVTFQSNGEMNFYTPIGNVFRMYGGGLSNGAGAQFFGNSSALPGQGYIDGGSVSGGDLIFRTGASTTEAFRVAYTGRSSFGGITATAIVHIKAGTATANTAPLKFSLPGVPLTTPEKGVLETDADNIYYTETSLIRKTLVGTIFTQTADKTVSNTVTETSIIGTGVGYGLTLPANFFVVGKTIRLRVGGVYSTPALATPSIIIKVKYGSTVIATVTTTSLLSGATNLEFDGEVLITCRSTGSSGTVMVHGDVEYSTGVAGTIAVDSLNNAGATTTINTTTSNLLDVTVQWDTNTSTRSVKSTVTTAEIVN